MATLISEIITNVKRRASIPDNQVSFTDADLLSFAQDAFNEVVYPEILSWNEEFFLVRDSIAVRNSSNELKLTNQIIPFPARCFGRELREVKYKNSSGALVNVPMMNLEDQDFGDGAYTYSFTQAAPCMYVFGDEIRILGNLDNLNGQFELTYPMKPQVLVNSATLHGSITNITYTSPTATFTIATNGADLETYFPAASVTTKIFDVMRRSSGTILFPNIAFSRGGATSLTTAALTENQILNLKIYQAGEYPVAGGYDSDLYLMPANKTNYTPIADEADPYLVLAIVDRYLEAIGDTEGMQVNAAKMDKARKSIIKALAKRIVGEPKVITNRRGIKAFFRSRARGF